MPNREQRRLAERKGNPVAGGNNQQHGQAAALYREETYYGPMPAPEDMLRYKECSEDLPSRIMTLAEESSQRETMKVENHKAIIENQKIAIRANSISNILGLVFAFMLSGACIATAVYFVLNDKNIQAFIAAIIPASVFFKTFFSKKK